MIIGADFSKATHSKSGFVRGSLPLKSWREAYTPLPPPVLPCVWLSRPIREIMSAWLRLSSFPSTKLEHGKTMNRLRIIKSTEGRPDKQSIDHSRPRLLLKKDFGPQEENYFFLFIERSKLFLRRPRKNSQEKC